MKYRYFTVDQLVAANNVAEKRNYNRQLEIDVLLSSPEVNEDTVFPVTFTMIHEHACGCKVDPHVRCMIGVPEGVAFIDCDMEIYNNLSTAEVTEDA